MQSLMHLNIVGCSMLLKWLIEFFPCTVAVLASGNLESEALPTSAYECLPPLEPWAAALTRPLPHNPTEHVALPLVCGAKHTHLPNL